jgi:hypothetical protein
LSVEKNSNVVTITGRFISVVVSVFIGDNECKMKHLSLTSLKCRLLDVIAGVYVPRVLTTFGYANVGNEIDEYTLKVDGKISGLYPKLASFAGGSYISLFGHGFSRTMSVMIIHELDQTTDLCKFDGCKIIYFSSQPREQNILKIYFSSIK